MGWAIIVTLVPTMILGSFATGAGLLCLRPDRFRRILVATVTFALCCGALALIGFPTPAGLPGFPLDHHHLNLLMLLIGCFMEALAAMLILIPILVPAAISFGR